MIAIAPISAALLAFVAQVVAPLFVGSLLGLIYFLSLLRAARLLVGGSTLLPLALQALRFVLLAFLLAMIARAFGAAALLAAVAGLLMARTAVLGWDAAP